MNGSIPLLPTSYGVQHSLVVRCVWDAEVQGSNPCTPTNLKLLPVELALGLRNRVANVRFIPRVPLYGVCSITGNAQGCEPCRCGIEARHTPQTQEDCQSGRSELPAKELNVQTFRGFESHIFLQFYVPFVYRLGHQVFNPARGVRFSYGIPL